MTDSIEAATANYHSQNATERASGQAVVDRSVELSNPFPGLRSFNLDETSLFFGRKVQTDALLSRLAASRFVAVIGSSGSGKSSLVRAGLLPSMHGGLMAGSSARWHVVSMNPGNDPIGNLAWAMNEVLGEDEEIARDKEIDAALIEATLHRSTQGLVRAVRDAHVPAGTNLLIFVDQFEELFRFKEADERRRNTYKERSLADRRSRQDDRRAGQERRSNRDRRLGNERPFYDDEAAEFVKLLIHAVNSRDTKVYVLITMRSDFLGDCARFRNLPETINDCQYLVPRMTRDDLSQAIAGPANVRGVRMTSRLIQFLLNEVGDDPDQLPVLQHALMRTWDYWVKNGATGPLDIAHYDAVGKMKNAISNHGKEVLGGEVERTDMEQSVVHKVFVCLAEKGADNRVIRRPSKISEIRAVTECEYDDIKGVIDGFSAPGCSFLRGDRPLTPDSIIDISHESLIRNWDLLVKWVDDESRSADIYRRLAGSAVRYFDEKTESLYKGRQLHSALTWRKKSRPNGSWARRYHPRFETAMRFLTKSRNQTRWIRLGIGLALAVVGVLIGAVGLSLKKANESDKLRGREDLRQAASLIAQDRAPTAFAYLNRALELDPDNGAVQTLIVNSLRYHNWAVPLWHAQLDSSIYDVDFSPDGQFAVASSTAGAVQVWNTETGELAAPERHFKASVNRVRFSPDGRLIVIAADDSVARIWNFLTDSIVGAVQHAGLVDRAAFSTDGRFVVTASRDATAKVINLSTGKIVVLPHDDWVTSASFGANNQVVTRTASSKVTIWNVLTLWSREVRSDGATSAEFSPDGRFLVTTSLDSTARVWRVSGDASVRLRHIIKHEGIVSSASFDPQSQRVATASFDNTARVWNLNGYTPELRLQHRGEVVAVAFNSLGTKIVTAARDGMARVWDTKTGSALTEPIAYDVPPGYVSRALLDSTDSRLITGSSSGAVQLWDIRAPADTVRVEHKAAVRAASFSPDPDAKWFVTGSDDHTARIWETQTGRSIGAPLRHDTTIRHVEFSPNGKRVLTASYDSTARVWDALTGDSVTPPLRHEGRVRMGSFSHNNLYVVTASDDWSARLWNAETGMPVGKVMWHDSIVRDAQFSPDDRWIVTASYDGYARVWQTATNDTIPISTMFHGGLVRSAQFSPDGQWVVTASTDQTARLWNYETGEEVEGSEPMRHANTVNSAMFSPDGKWIVTASDDGSAQVWDAESGNPLSAPMRHDNAVYGAWFSPDGELVATAAFDSSARLWDAMTGRQIIRIQHENRVTSTAFSRDGKWVVAGSHDGDALVRDISVGDLSVGDLQGLALVFGGTWIPNMMPVFSDSIRWARLDGLRQAAKERCSGATRLILCSLFMGR